MQRSVLLSITPMQTGRSNLLQLVEASEQNSTLLFHTPTVRGRPHLLQQIGRLRKKLNS